MKNTKPKLFTIFSALITLIFLNVIALHTVYLCNNNENEKQILPNNFLNDLNTILHKLERTSSNLEKKYKNYESHLERNELSFQKKEIDKSKLLKKYEKSNDKLLKQNKILLQSNKELQSKLTTIINERKNLLNQNNQDDNDDDYGQVYTLKIPHNRIKLINLKKTYPPSLVAETKIKYVDISKKNVNIVTSTKRKNVIYKIDKKVVEKFARSFTSADVSSWCIPDSEFRNTTPTGLLYVRVPKTGSSTVAGVLQRISEIHGSIQYNNTIKCALQNQHDDKFTYKHRNKQKSYLIGSIRNPAKRAISRVFFQYISKLNYTPTDVNIYKFLHTTDSQLGAISNGRGGFQLYYMNIDTTYVPSNASWKLDSNNEKMLNMTYITNTIQSILQNYQFIFLNERLDECLVLLKFLLNLSINDILYLSSKVSSQEDTYYKWGNYSTSKCIKLQKSFVSPKIKEYLNSKIWIEKNYGDYLLYDIVNRSIDLTIDEVVGRDEFNGVYRDFRERKEKAVGVCGKEAILPCDGNGRYQFESVESCYFEDVGCGHKCLDRMSFD